MKYDKTLIGENVVDNAGIKGHISNISEDGAIEIKFANSPFSGKYLFDPFLNSSIQFVNPKLQAVINDEIEDIRKEKLSLVKKSISKNIKEETFYITKDNPDKSKEIVYRLKCDKQQALSIFSFVVNEQILELKNSNPRPQWRVLRMFDSTTNEQICQES